MKDIITLHKQELLKQRQESERLISLEKSISVIIDDGIDEYEYNLVLEEFLSDEWTVYLWDCTLNDTVGEIKFKEYDEALKYYNHLIQKHNLEEKGIYENKDV